MRVIRFKSSLNALSIILVAVKLITGIITVSAVMGVYLPKNRYIDHRPILMRNMLMTHFEI